MSERDFHAGGGRRRVDVQLSEALWATFEQDAARDDLTPAEALRRALSVYVLVREGQRKGALFLLLAPDGTIERLIFGD